MNGYQPKGKINKNKPPSGKSVKKKVNEIIIYFNDILEKTEKELNDKFSTIMKDVEGVNQSLFKRIKILEQLEEIQEESTRIYYQKLIVKAILEELNNKL